MESHIEIIDGQEVVVKVYKTRPLPKKVTAKRKGGRMARMKKQKHSRVKSTEELE